MAANGKIDLSGLPLGIPGPRDTVAGVDTATGMAKQFPMPVAGEPRDYQTFAELPPPAGLQEGTTAHVNNDPIAENNGRWAVFGGVWVQSSDRTTAIEVRVNAAEVNIGDLDDRTDALTSLTNVLQSELSSEVDERKGIIDRTNLDDEVAITDSMGRVLSRLGSGLDLDLVGLHVEQGDKDQLQVIGKNGVVIFDTGTVANTEGSGDTAASGLKSLRLALADPTQSVVVTAIGDSITWGSGASNPGPAAPGAHSLDDDRSNYTCKSWANLLRRWLAAQAGGWSGEPVEVAPGYAYFSVPNWLDLGDEDQVIRESPGIIYGGEPNATNYQYLDLPPGGSVSFTLLGNSVDVVFRTQATDVGGQMKISSEGVETDHPSYSEVPSYGTVASRTEGGVASRPFYVTNDSTSAVRLEGVRHNRHIGLRNNGISGTATWEWTPDRALLVGGVPPDTTHAFVQLGTNDRGSRIRPYMYPNYMGQILAWLRASRPLASVIMMGPPKAAPDRDHPSPLYYATTGDMARQAQLMARKFGLSFIDNHAVTQRLEMAEIEYLADGLHPNDTGYVEMFLNITNHILED